MGIEEIRIEFARKLDGLERDVNVLSERIKNAKEDVCRIKDMHDADVFCKKYDMEDGLKYIAIFDK